MTREIVGELNPRKLILGPDVLHGDQERGSIEGGDGHIDLRQPFFPKANRGAAPAAEGAEASGRAVFPRSSLGESESAEREGGPRDEGGARGAPAIGAMAVAEMRGRAGRAVAQGAAEAPALEGARAGGCGAASAQDRS